MVRRVFLSYSRTDHDIAEAIAHTISELGYEVWWDRDLLPAQEYRPAISEQLERADAIVVLWSTASVQSQWVIDEAERGAAKKNLIPIALGTLDPKAIPLGLNSRHLIFCGGRGNSGSGQFKRELVEALTHLREPNTLASPSASASSKSLSVSALLAGTGVFAAMLLAGLGAYVLAPKTLRCEGIDASVALNATDERILSSRRSVASATLAGLDTVRVSGVVGIGQLADAMMACENPTQSGCTLQRQGDRLTISAFSYAGWLSLSSGDFSVRRVISDGQGMISITDSGRCSIQRRWLS